MAQPFDQLSCAKDFEFAGPITIEGTLTIKPKERSQGSKARANRSPDHHTSFHSWSFLMDGSAITEYSRGACQQPEQYESDDDRRCGCAGGCAERDGPAERQELR